jgi:hypothetical protein
MTLSEDQAASMFPDAWSRIEEQVAEVKRCSDGATLLFLGAQAHGNQLRAIFAHDMNTLDGYACAIEFRADVARLN